MTATTLAPALLADINLPKIDFSAPPPALELSLSTASTSSTSSWGVTSAGSQISSDLIAPLGPLSSLPTSARGLKEWKILLLCTAVNSFSQRVITYLDYLGFTNVSVQIASSDEAMAGACESWDPDLVVCPFLTRRIPDKVFGRVSRVLS